MSETTANLENALDTNNKVDGLQLPKTFEDTFKDSKNRLKLVAAAKDTFAGMTQDNKTAINGAAATEIQSWQAMPKKGEEGYNGKMAVLYLYTSLNDSKPNPSIADVTATFDTLKQVKKISEVKPNTTTNNRYGTLLPEVTITAKAPTYKIQPKIANQIPTILPSMDTTNTTEKKPDELKWTSKEVKKRNGLFDGKGTMEAKNINGSKIIRIGKRNEGKFTGKEKITDSEGAVRIAKYKNDELSYTNIYPSENGKLTLNESVIYHFNDMEFSATKDTSISINDNLEETITGPVTLWKEDGKGISYSTLGTFNKKGTFKETTLKGKNNIDTISDFSIDIERATALVTEANKIKQKELKYSEITSLTPEVAEQLSKFNGDYIFLDGITSLTPEVAIQLKKYPGQLLMNLDEESKKLMSADITSKNNKTIDTTKSVKLENKQQKSEKTGSQINNNIVDTSISNITVEEVTDLVTKANENNDGTLDLNGITSINTDIAIQLSNFNGSVLSLDGITSITPDIAKQLSNFRGDALFLDGVTSITPDIATQLSNFKGNTLSLDGITLLTPEVATQLSNFKGNTLSLDGITLLTPDIATQLSNFKGYTLSLNGIASLTPDIATQLSNFKGHTLSLYGIASLTPDIAEQLSNFKGGALFLHGITSITPEIATQLKKYPGQLLMNLDEESEKLMSDLSDITSEKIQKGYVSPIEDTTPKTKNSNTVVDQSPTSNVISEKNNTPIAVNISSDNLATDTKNEKIENKTDVQISGIEKTDTAYTQLQNALKNKTQVAQVIFTFENTDLGVPLVSGSVKVIDKDGVNIFEQTALLTTKADTARLLINYIAKGIPASEAATNTEEQVNEVQITGLDKETPSYLQLQNVLKNIPQASQVDIILKKEDVFTVGKAIITYNDGTIGYETDWQAGPNKETTTGFLIDKILENYKKTP